MRALAFASILALAACASEPSGERAAPPPTADAPPVSAAPAPDPGLAAPGVRVEPDRPVVARDGDVTVPGGRERPVTPPRGDPRTQDQRMSDIRRWDNCVMRLQDAVESNPTRPILESPEEVCSRQLGMRDRLAVPYARLP